MKHRKSIALILLLAAASLLLAACMNDGGARLSATPEPTANYAPDATRGTDDMSGATATPIPGATAGAAGNTTSTTDGALTPFDWANSAAAIEQSIGQIGRAHV